ncbi:MAG: S8 family serine peptidase, partial [Lachnospiraceae bacterium]
SSLPMTVTAYDARDNSLYINASRGYTTTGIVKPDFAAPGVEVYGAGLRNQFVTRSGTSGAAAVAAGACALLLEWMVVRGNFSIVTNTELKNIFMRSADKDSGRLYPNRDWGYGRLNVYRAFEMFRLY